MKRVKSRLVIANSACRFAKSGVLLQRGARERRCPFPRAPIPKSKILRALCRSSLEKKPLSTYEDTSFFFGMVKPQPGDISTVEKMGTLLLWYDNCSQCSLTGSANSE